MPEPACSAPIAPILTMRAARELRRCGIAAREGFNTFSKLRPVFYQGPLSPIQMLFQPPYSGRPMSVLKTMIKWKT